MTSDLPVQEIIIQLSEILGGTALMIITWLTYFILTITMVLDDIFQ